MKVVIHTPIWNGGNRAVGIADYRLQGKVLQIEIDYKDSHGNRMYPDVYTVPCDKARVYPTQTVKGTKLHIIPIADLEWL